MKRVSAVVLAAGPSRRYVEAGGGLKQLLLFEGESLVRRTTRTALASSVAQVVVVIGCEARTVRHEVEDLDVDIAVNARFAEGRSTSVQAGLSRVESTADGAIFLPCDQLFLSAATLDRILEAYAASEARIVVPSFAGGRRAPVLFDRALFGALGRITGDSGGRQLFDAHEDRLVEVEFGDELPFLDVDTPSDYERLIAPPR